MTRDPDDLLLRLAAANPVSTRSLQGLATSPSAQELLTRITGDEAVVMGRSRSPRRKLAWLAAAAVVVAVTVVATQVLPGNPPANAQQALREAATQASEQPPPPPGTYGYVKTLSRTLVTYSSPDGPWSTIIPSTTEQWIAADGSGRILDVPGDLTFPGPRDRLRWEAAGSPDFSKSTDQSFGPGGSGVPLDGLSTDASTLADQLRTRAEAKQSGPPVNVEMFQMVSDLLSQPEASSELRAALFRVAAGIDGVQLLGTVQDDAGRTGTAVAIDYSASGFATRQTIIFDPTTSQILEQRETLLEPVPFADAQPPIVTSSTLYLQSGIVDSTSTRPAT